MSEQLESREREGLRWGINLMPDQPVRSVTELAVAAERAGFHRCWLYDEGLATRELYVTLTAIALATDQLVVGPGITNPYTRHPSVTAAAVASLYELSGGRAFLGLGPGGGMTLNPIGVARHRPALALRESVEAIRALFGGTTTTVRGETVELDAATLPYGDATIPIWVAGRGPRVLAVGAERADGVALDHLHRDTIAERVGDLRRVAGAVGNELEIAYAATLVVDDASLERVRRHMTYRLVDSPHAAREAIGLTDRHRNQLREAMVDGLDAAARLVRDDWILPFVVHGTVAECGERIAALIDAHGFVEFTVPAVDANAVEETIETARAVFGHIDGLAQGTP